MADAANSGTGSSGAGTTGPVTQGAIPNPLVGLLAIAAAVFAFLAFWDLALRDKDDVVGPKPVWIPVILVQWIGPAAYFLFGIKR